MSLPEKYFALEWVFPDVQAIFAQENIAIDQSKKDAIVFLDTNVLLALYKLDAASLQEVKKVYQYLQNQGRLFVPIRAMREFIRNRPTKIAELIQTVRDHSSAGAAPKNRAIEALRGNPSYEAVISQAQEIDLALKKFRKAVDDVVSQIEGWIDGADPVVDTYKEVFQNCFCDLDMNDTERQEFIREQKFRQDLKIPPGYKDISKPDEGSGDLIIWKTILRKVGTESRNAIFVTLEEKGDWFIKGGGILQTRPELQEEFRRASNGKRIYVVSMSTFLKLFEADPNVVAATDFQNAPDVDESFNDKVDLLEITLQNRLRQVEDEHSKLFEALQSELTEERSSDNTYWHTAAPNLQKRLRSLREQSDILRRRLAEIRGD